MYTLALFALFSAMSGQAGRGYVAPLKCRGPVVFAADCPTPFPTLTEAQARSAIAKALHARTYNDTNPTTIVAVSLAAPAPKPTPIPHIVAVNLGITRVLPAAPKAVVVVMPTQKAPTK